MASQLIRRQMIGPFHPCDRGASFACVGANSKNYVMFWVAVNEREAGL